MRFNPYELDGFHFKIIRATSQYEYYSVGDIHGCAVEIHQLMEKLYEDASERKRLPMIFQHGDFIDRGPYFLEAFKETVDCIGILGNHEHNFVLERLGKPCNSSARKRSHEQFEALSEMTQHKVMRRLNELLNFVIVQFDADDDEEQTFKDCVLSHSPIKGMSEYYHFDNMIYKGNAPYFCMQSKDIDDDEMKNNCKPLLNTDFIYGHQSWAYTNIEIQKEKQKDRRAQYFNIDSGCVYGGQLTALRLRDRKAFQVQSAVKVDKS